MLRRVTGKADPVAETHGFACQGRKEGREAWPNTAAVGLFSVIAAVNICNCVYSTVVLRIKEFYGYSSFSVAS
jgi:hypothetical protein